MSRHRNEMPEDIVNRLVNETGWRISFLDSMEDDFSASEEKTGLHAVCGNDNISDKSWLACKQDMIKKEKERFVLIVHTHKIWQQPGKGLWTTYLRKENDKLGKITSKSYEGLIEKLYQHYLEGTTSIVLKDLWPEVMVWKRNQISGKTLKEADRLWKKYYASDPISSKKITEIGMKDWKKFFAKIITANGLTRKQFSEIRTVANYIVRYCILNDILEHNTIRDLADVEFPFRKTAPYNSIKAPHFAENDIEKIKEVCDQEILDTKKRPIYPLAIKFNLSYGLRIGELSALKWSDVDFENRTIYISHQYVVDFELSDDGTFRNLGRVDTNSIKGHEEPRILPLTDEGIEILEKVKELDLPGEYIFQIRYNTYNNRIKDIAAKVKVSEVVFRTHSLRTTAARSVYRKCGDVKVVQSLLGHTTPGMTFKYIKDFDNLERLRAIL